MKKIIWDADNTIWDWVGYAIHSYSGALTCICAETGLKEEIVIEAMRKFYGNAGTIEHSGLIQGLAAQGLFNGLKNFSQKNLIQKIRKIFRENRNDNLHIYPGMKEILQKTHKASIQNIILTDAPGIHARMRIKHFKLEPYISQMFARPTPSIEDMPEDVKKNIKNGKYDVSFPVTEIASEKPFTNLTSMLQMTREQIMEFITIIGDNDAKDMELARKFNCNGIHAVYGIADQASIGIITHFLPKKVLKKNMSLPTATPPTAHPKIHQASSPHALLSLLLP